MSTEPKSAPRWLIPVIVSVAVAVLIGAVIATFVVGGRFF